MIYTLLDIHHLKQGNIPNKVCCNTEDVPINDI